MEQDKPVLIQKTIQIPDLDLNGITCNHCKSINIRKDGNMIVCLDCGNNFINPDMLKDRGAEK